MRGVAGESRQGPVAPALAGLAALKAGVALEVSSWKVSQYRGVSQLHCRLSHCRLRLAYLTPF